MTDFGVKNKVRKIFCSSSACMYPAHNQEDPRNPKCAESTAYPAAPDSEYGGEKLFSERLYLAFSRNYGLDHGNRPKKVDDQARIRPHGRPWPQFRQALIRTELGREPNMRLQQGLAKTYDWSQVRSAARAEPLA